MNFLKFLKRYPLIMAFVVSIAVANIWDLVQNAKKIEVFLQLVMRIYTLSSGTQ